nr:Rap1a/Tai family immunity protein [Pseudomonas sp. LA21]
MIGVANAANEGNELLASCGANVAAMDNPDGVLDYYKIGHCQGLIGGLMDVLDRNNSQPLLRSCLPGNVSMGQTTRIVVRYLQDHPEQLHLPDTRLVLMAIQEAFPCQ